MGGPLVVSHSPLSTHTRSGERAPVTFSSGVRFGQARFVWVDLLVERKGGEFLLVLN
jgi:hypothetical protein